MKLSPYMQEISRAYDELQLMYAVNTRRLEYAFSYQPRRPNDVLPRSTPHPRPPHYVSQVPPQRPSTDTPFAQKEKLVLLAAFQSTFQRLLYLQK